LEVLAVLRPDGRPRGHAGEEAPAAAAPAGAEAPLAEDEVVALAAVLRQLDGLLLLAGLGEIEVVLLGEEEELAVRRVGPRVARPVLAGGAFRLVDDHLLGVDPLLVLVLRLLVAGATLAEAFAAGAVAGPGGRGLALGRELLALEV